MADLKYSRFPLPLPQASLVRSILGAAPIANAEITAEDLKSFEEDLKSFESSKAPNFNAGMNVDKVKKKLIEMGVSEPLADELASRSVGDFDDAVIGDDEAQDIAIQVGAGLEGGKPSGSAFISIDEETSKLPDLPASGIMDTDVAQESFGQEPETKGQGIESFLTPDSVDTTQESFQSPTFSGANILTVDFNEDDDIYNVFPVPRKIAEEKFDRKENFYRATDSEGNVSDITGQEFEKVQIRISDTYDKSSMQVANQTLDDESYLDLAPKGTKIVRVNLNKKYPKYKEGNMMKNWEWVQEPEGYQFDETKVFDEDIGKDVLQKTPTIVSNVYGGKHHYSLGTDFDIPVDMAYYSTEKSEPRLKPTTKAKHMILGNKVGEIKIRDIVHPVYDNITFANETKFFVDGGEVDVKQFDLARVINKHLTSDLLGKDYKKDAPCKAGDTTGHCFITTQAAWFELGGKDSGYVPRMLTHKEFPEALKPGETHHYLINPNTNEVIDLTYDQFEKKNINQYDIPYQLGKKSGYQNQAIENNKPTERTQKLLDRVNAENNNPQDAAQIVNTDSGVEINFANRRARDLEMGEDIENYLNYSNYSAEGTEEQSERFGKAKAIEGHGEDPRFLFGFKNKDGSQGYAYGYLTDKNVAFVDQLNATTGSFSPQEYKEIKDAVKEYTGASKVGGFRVTGARSGAYDKQATVMKAAGGIVDKPLYDR